MKIHGNFLSILFITVVSCSLQSNKIEKTVGINQETLVEFEEINHVNVKLINSEYKILKSQDEINGIYKKINKENPSPRKNPIPSYSESETYIVIQPNINQTDFIVSEVLENGKNLEVKIQQYYNPEFKNKKNPASIIKLNKKSNYDNVNIKQ